jgi:hypothetical protein
LLNTYLISSRSFGRNSRAKSSSSGLPRPSYRLSEIAVYLLILDVSRQFVVQFVEVGKFGVQIDPARPPAQNGLMFAEAAPRQQYRVS